MKLIHCADIHLDSPMQTHMTAQQASVRNTEMLQSFVRLTEFAQERAVRAVLIAGDLFDVGAGARAHGRRAACCHPKNAGGRLSVSARQPRRGGKRLLRLRAAGESEAVRKDMDDRPI